MIVDLRDGYDPLTTEATHPQIAAGTRHPLREQIRDGVVAMVPLWPGVASFAIAFGVMARSAGYNLLETQMMSMLVFAGSAQLAMVTLYAGGAGALAIILTALILNLRHVLYGLATDRQIAPDERPFRPLLAFFLTDESYGVTTRAWLAGRGSAGFMLGTGISLYVVFALSTLMGVLFGSQLPDVERSGIAFIFPLSFLILLIPLLRSVRQLSVAILAGAISLGTGQFLGGGVAILLATFLGATAGVVAERRHRGA